MKNAQFFEIIKKKRFIVFLRFFRKKIFLTVMSRGLSHEPKEFLKMVPGQNKSLTLYRSIFEIKKKGLQVSRF